MPKIIPTTGALIRGIAESEAATVVVTLINEVLPASSTPVNYYDAVVNECLSLGSQSSYHVDVAPPQDHPQYSIENLTPTIWELQPSGEDFNGLANGLGEFTVTAYGGKRKFSRSCSLTQYSYKAHSSYRAGSVGLHVKTAIDTLISGKTPGDITQARWQSNNFDVNNPVAVQNPSLFTATYSLEAVSIMRTGVGAADKFPGILVTPRHILGAWHVLPQAGVKLVWKTVGGQYRSATVLNTRKLADSTANDIGCAYLDTAVADIQPIKVLPANWLNFLGSHRLPGTVGYSSCNYGGLPMLCKSYNPTESAYSRMNIVTGVAELGNIALNTSQLNQDATLTWSKLIDGGDSGSPVMLPINGELVLVTAMYTRAGNKPFCNYITQINADMNYLAGLYSDATVYALDEFNLTAAGFTSYV